MKFSRRAIGQTWGQQFGLMSNRKLTPASAGILAAFWLERPYPRGLCFVDTAGGQTNHAAMTANKTTE